MRLLVEAISAKRGGIVTYTHNLVTAMRERGIDATFAVPHNFQGEGDHIIRLPASDYAPARRFVWEQTMWRQIVSRIRPDVLFSSANFGLFRSPVPQVLLVREGGLFDPYYLTNIAPTQGLATAILRQWRRWLMLASADWADLVITPTAATRDQLLHWQPSLSKKIEVCSYGTRTELFKPDHERGWRSDGELRLIYVSVYYPHKNPGVIFEAARLLNEQTFPTTATVTMSYDEIRQVRGSALDVAQLMRAPREKIQLGPRAYQDLPAIYGKHDVFVFPSVSETFGHPMVEAMSMGLPIVAADSAVNREVCGDVALYFHPFSATDLIAQLRRLDADPELRQRMKIAGRERCDQLFRWDRHVDLLVTLLHKLVPAAA